LEKDKKILREKLENEKNMNDNLSVLINKLKIKNKDLESKLNELENKNNLENENKNFKIPSNSNNINIINENDFSNQEENINKLNKKIKDLEEKLERYPCILEKNEKLISIIIYSEDKSIHHSIISKNTDIFNKIVNEIYKIYPEISEKNNIFTYKGKIIDKSKSIDNNEIKDGDVVILSQK